MHRSFLWHCSVSMRMVAYTCSSLCQNRWEWWHIHVLHYVKIDEKGGIYMFFIMSKPFARMKGTFCLDWIRYWHKETFIWQVPYTLHCDIRWADAPFLYVPVILVRWITMNGTFQAFVGILIKLDRKYLSPFSSCVRDHIVRHLQLRCCTYGMTLTTKLIQQIPDKRNSAMIVWCQTNSVATELLCRYRLLRRFYLRCNDCMPVWNWSKDDGVSRTCTSLSRDMSEWPHPKKEESTWHSQYKNDV